MNCNVAVTGGFAVVFGGRHRTLAKMSLNRCEQHVFDYLERNRDERQFWHDKVRRMAKVAADEHAAAAQLASELWRYYEERGRVAAAFRESMPIGGLQKTSMRNLAELLLRLWVEPRPRKKPDPGLK